MSEDVTRATPDSELNQEPAADEEITPLTAFKLLLFLVWWFSGIGVGTAFMAPEIVGTAISAELFMVIVLAFFCSMLLIIVLAPGQDDDFDPGADDQSGGSTGPESGETAGASE